MKRYVLLLSLLGTAGSAWAGPDLVPTTKGKVTVGVPKDWTVAVGDRCIAFDGAGSLWVIRTSTTQDAFEKAEAKAKGAKKVAKDKVVCFEQSEPGENARCMVTTEAGRWVTQFVAFGKQYSKLGGAAAMQAIVTSIKGFEGKPYDATFPGASDCPVP